MVGRCCVKSWSKTQGTIAQSSAESELIATVRGATEAIGLVSLALDLGIVMLVRLHIDASAALGIIERRGVGRVRHLDVGTLWLQEQQLRRVVEFKKVEGLNNPEGLCTKPLSRERIDTYTKLIGYKFADGRAELAVTLNSCASQSVEDTSARTVRAEGELPQESAKWFQVSPTHWRGSFRSARSHRSPCSVGVSWPDISRIVARTSPHGRIIRDVRPKDLGITEKQYCNNLGGCPDIVVDCYLNARKIVSSGGVDSSRQESCSRADRRMLSSAVELPRRMGSLVNDTHLHTRINVIQHMVQTHLHTGINVVRLMI